MPTCAVTSHVFLLELPPERRWRMLQMGRQRRRFSFFPSRMLGVSPFLSIPWLEAFFWNRNQLVGSFKCVFFFLNVLSIGGYCVSQFETIYHLSDIPCCKWTRSLPSYPLVNRVCWKSPKGRRCSWKSRRSCSILRSFHPGMIWMIWMIKNYQELLICKFYISPRIHKPLVNY